MPKGYQCCICEKLISREEENASLALAALNMRDWLRDIPEPRNGMVWAHFDCMAKAWPGRDFWDAEYFVGPSK